MLFQITFQHIDIHSLLLPSITVADGNGVVFERLVIDRNAERRTDFVLSSVEPADAAGVVVNGTH